MVTAHRGQALNWSIELGIQHKSGRSVDTVAFFLLFDSEIVTNRWVYVDGIDALTTEELLKLLSTLLMISRARVR